jgi:O-antigen/teichoic acid export membrane protein
VIATETKTDAADERELRPEAATPALDTAERVRLMRQGLLNICGPVASGLIGIVLVPVMLRGLGAELYGVWVIVATVVGRCAATADLGVSWSVIREVAAAGGDIDDAGGSVERLVSSAANFYLALAIAGAVLIAALGLPMNRLLAMSSPASQILPRVFVLAAAGFIASQMFNFQIVVLQGLRRFDLSNLLSILSALVSGIGIIVVIALGGSLLSVVGVQALTFALCAVAGYKLVINTQPRFRQRLGRFEWASLKPRMRFSLGSQMVSLLSGLIWESGPLLIGFMLGPVWVSYYHVGRKFPAAVGALVWPFAVVMFPAASEHQRVGDLARAGEALEAGTGWLVLLTAPICVILWMLAPHLLQAWLGRTPSDVLPVFRLLTVTVLANAMCLAAVGVLLGRGAIGQLLPIACIQAASVVGLTVLLVAGVGVRGAAWALCLVTPFSSAALLHVAARSCGTSMYAILHRTWTRLWMPGAACVAATFVAMQVGNPGRWPNVMFTAAAGTIVYAITFYLWSAREEERILARQGLDLLGIIAAQSHGVVRAIPSRLGVRPNRRTGVADR